MNPGIEMSTEALREFNLGLINDVRSQKVPATFKFMGHNMNGDDISVANMLSASLTSLMMLSQGKDMPEGFSWRTADNYNIPVRATDILNMSITYFQYRAACYQRSWELKAKVAELSGQDLLDLDIMTGWPS